MDVFVAQVPSKNVQYGLARHGPTWKLGYFRLDNPRIDCVEKAQIVRI